MLCSWVNQEFRLGHVFWCFFFVCLPEGMCWINLSSSMSASDHNISQPSMSNLETWMTMAKFELHMNSFAMPMFSDEKQKRSQSHTGVVPQLCREMTVLMWWIKVLFFIPQRSMQWQLNQIDQIDIFSRSSRSFWKEVSGVWCRGQVPSPNMSSFFL